MSKTISTGLYNTGAGGLAIVHSLPCNPGNYDSMSSREVSYIVLHYTGNQADTARANAQYFHNNNGIWASAHFFVDESCLYQSVNLRDMAWHCGTDGTYYHPSCRNWNSIGVEMCTSGEYRVSPKTKENAAQLCASLCILLGIGPESVDKYVLRHWDVTHKNCPAQMAGAQNEEWQAFKARVKTILQEDVPMTKAEVEKLIASAVQKSADKLEKKMEEQSPRVYNTLEEVPDYWREDIRWLSEQGILQGNGNGQLGLTRSEAKAAVLVRRGLSRLQGEAGS